MSATILISTPTFCQAYYRTCGPEDFKTLRHVVVGAERLRPDFAAQFKEKFGIELLEGYGATEMGPVVSVNVPNVVHDGRAAGRQQARHGRPPAARRGGQGGRSGDRPGSARKGRRACCC